MLFISFNKILNSNIKDISVYNDLCLFLPTDGAVQKCICLNVHDSV